MSSAEAAALAGRHALVTGGGSGIGAACAAALARTGVRVSLVGRTADPLNAVAEQLGGSAHAQAIPADVTDPSAVEAAFNAARTHFGPVHILINNAGRAASAKLTDTDPQLWQSLLAVNLTASFLCARQAIADMLAEKFGRIVNIASTAGLRGGAYVAAYSAAKHGVVGLTRSLALEYALHGITVNALCPGYTDTDIVKETVVNIAAKTGRTQSEALEALLATNPQRRLIQTEEVAHAMLFLCLPGTESITGQSLVIAGGEVH